MMEADSEVLQLQAKECQGLSVENQQKLASGKKGFPLQVSEGAAHILLTL